MSERVLVLGATSAIAQATARLWAARGARLFLVARDATKLEAVVADLRARGATDVGSRVADLDRPWDHVAIVADAIAALGEIDMALIAHGTLGDQKESEASPVAALRELHTNFLGAASLLTVLSNTMQARGAGTIGVITSVAGDRGRVSNYVYGSAKGGLSLFVAGLRARLSSKGVRVVDLKPGFVDTPMTQAFAKGLLWASPATVAKGIVRAMDRGTGVAYLPWFWRWIMLVIRLIPEPIFIRMKL